MNYIRTFFNRPLKQLGKGVDILALDFSKITVVYADHEVWGDGNYICLTEESWRDFLQVFEEYCRDMQSQERFSVRMPTAPVEMPKQIGGQEIIPRLSRSRPADKTGTKGEK